MSRSIYTARWVLPIDGEPIVDGRVVVEDGMIVEVGPVPAGPGRTRARDFGEAVLMPGFVNAHTHLELTALRGFLEDVDFFPWIRALIALKSRIDVDGWLTSSRLGALESIAGGVTTIGDNTDSGATAQVLSECGLRAVVFQEVFGIDDREPVEPIVEALRAKIGDHRRFASDRIGIGVSPHALYTVRPALMAALRADPELSALPWSMHIAESSAESLLTENGVGPFAEMYSARGIRWQAPGMSPTAYAAKIGALGPRTLAVHCVHQDARDFELLEHYGTTVVHCPKSNAKLGAGIAPLAAWLREDGLRIALGTDSAVSNNSLDMFEEMRFALLLQRAANDQVLSISARDVLRMATLGGADALGLNGVTGTLTPGKCADMIAVRLDGPHTTPASDPYSALVYSARAGDVVFTLCDGVALYDAGHWPTLDSGATMSEARELRKGM